MGKGALISIGITMFAITLLNVCGANLSTTEVILIAVASSFIGIGINWNDK